MATPSERLYARVRSAVESTPAATTRTRTRVIAALAIVPALTTASLLIGLALASTVFALWQGRSGLGIASMWLASITALVAPVYAALTVLQPLHSGAADDVSLTGVAISPGGLRCIFIASVVGASVLAIFAVTLRRAVAVAVGLRGAALGAAAGGWAGGARISQVWIRV